MLDRSKLIYWAIAGALIPTALLVLMMLSKTGGVWEYALDDVYIHLAMSEQIVHGEYRVNAGEAASASSSILYPYLLAPFASFEWHVWWPLVLGVIALCAAAVLWARVLETAYAENDTAWSFVIFAFALLGPLFLNFPALALIGMEHMLHVVAALMVCLGLIRFLQTGSIGWVFILGVVLNPLLRFEGMALSLLACGMLAVQGRPVAAIGILIVTAVPMATHFAYMDALGLDMLPNSVNAKAGIVGSGADIFGGADANNRLRAIVHSWSFALAFLSGRLLFGVMLAFGLGVFLARRQLSSGQIFLGGSVILAALAHVSLGSVAPFFRYELYVWAYAAAVGIYLLAQIYPRTHHARRGKAILALIAFCVGGLHYPTSALEKIPAGGAAVFAQQRQMGIFVDNFWKAPIAVNDLGHVAYRNPYYVLDLWGLASAEALAARSSRTDPLSADKLAHRYEVKAAMIYRHWLAAHIPPNWEPVARLKLTIPIATLGGNIVTFYAITPDERDMLIAKLHEFAKVLPSSAELDFLPVTQQTNG
jgi:hypothetical protein